MKKCSTALVIREMKLKPQWDTISYPLVWLLKKKSDNKYW